MGINNNILGQIAICYFSTHKKTLGGKTVSVVDCGQVKDIERKHVVRLEEKLI